MGKPTGFIEIARKKQPTRPVTERTRDWQEVYLPYTNEALQQMLGCDPDWLYYGEGRPPQWAAV